MNVYTERMQCDNGFVTSDPLCVLPAENCCPVSRNI